LTIVEGIPFLISGFSRNADCARFNIKKQGLSLISFHIFSPQDGLPPEECQSVPVICKEGKVADALATAVLVLGPEKGYTL